MMSTAVALLLFTHLHHALEITGPQMPPGIREPHGTKFLVPGIFQSCVAGNKIRNRNIQLWLRRKVAAQAVILARYPF